MAQQHTDARKELCDDANQVAQPKAIIRNHTLNLTRTANPVGAEHCRIKS
jgi:hypothetical protein